MTVIIIDGNVAAGKTSLSKRLEKYFRSKGVNATCLEESFDPKLLSKYIADPVRYGAKFALDIARRKKSLVEQASQGEGLFIMDRSPYGDMAFFDWRLARGDITAETHAQLREILRPSFEILSKDHATLLYLKVSPELCLDRCRERARDGEHLYDINFFRQIEEYNDRLFVDHIVLDGTEYVSPELIESLIKKN